MRNQDKQLGWNTVERRRFKMTTFTKKTCCCPTILSPQTFLYTILYTWCCFLFSTCHAQLFSSAVVFMVPLLPESPPSPFSFVSRSLSLPAGVQQGRWNLQPNKGALRGSSSAFHRAVRYTTFHLALSSLLCFG